MAGRSTPPTVTRTNAMTDTRPTCGECGVPAYGHLPTCSQATNDGDELMPRPFKFQHRGTTYTGKLVIARYQNNSIAVLLKNLASDGDSWEVYSKLSINIEELDLTNTNCIAAKNYSENEGLLEEMIRLGFFEDTGVKWATGYVTVPMLRLTRSGTEAAGWRLDG